VKKADTEILQTNRIPQKERITRKNPGARIQDREYKSSVYVV
jgi:hypothetical protein